VLLPEIVLAHAIEERAAAIQPLEELRGAEIEDLQVCYVPWPWQRVMGWIGQLYRKVLDCCVRQAPEAEERGVEIGMPRVNWTLVHS
jgi:hypothetical protein